MDNDCPWNFDGDGAPPRFRKVRFMRSMPGISQIALGAAFGERQLLIQR